MDSNDAFGDGQDSSTAAKDPSAVEDYSPPISEGERDRLLEELRKAARLLEKGQMPEEEYAALAVYNLIRLDGQIAQGESLRCEKIGFLDYLSENAWQALTERAGGSLEKSVVRFGPWNKATSWLSDVLPTHRSGRRNLVRFEWTEEADELLEGKRLRLSWWSRWKFRWEERIERNRRHFPHTTDQLQKAMIAILGGAVGALITALLTGV